MRTVDDTCDSNHTLSVLTLDGRRNFGFDNGSEILDTDSVAGAVVDDDIFYI